MPRIRTVKPDYPQHRKTRSVTRDARLLNVHLWNLADDEGRLQELPQWIIGAVFPADEDVTPGLLREWLHELSVAGLIERYEVGGEHYIQCHDFNDHQVISHARESELPSLADADSGTSNLSPVEVPEPSTPEGNGMEQGMEGKGKSVADAPDAPLCTLLADLIAERDPNGKRPSISKSWLEAEDRMLRLDSRRPDEAERLIRWTLADEFWGGNVRSMPKFRERYGQLYDAAVAASKKRKGKGASAGMQQAHRFAEKARQAAAEERRAA